MKACPICGQKCLEDKGEYSRCLSCGVVRTKFDYDANQYDESYAINYLNYAKSPINKSLNLFRLGIVAKWLKSDARILDVGCCVGEFIRFAEPHYKCVGFEPNAIAAKTAIARTSLNSTIVTELDGHRGFDCATLFDVIEHVQDPHGLLKHLHNILNTDGILVVATPCVQEITDNKMKEWKHYKPKEHLFLYTNPSLATLLSENGFHILSREVGEGNIRPGNKPWEIMTYVARRS